ncbi:MAG: YcgL domain-containing protein [Gammaproteobacteria bacterium]|nr:YcgL domain-containing protein [Gammaproteobacteria bacterium]
MSAGRLVQVYRSSRREGHYLFVDLAEGLARVPEPLLVHFGRPEPALRLNLTRQRRLAQADAGAVLDAIAEKGFYLQLPPQPESGKTQPGAEG